MNILEYNQTANGYTIDLPKSFSEKYITINGNNYKCNTDWNFGSSTNPRYKFMYLCCHPGCCKFTHNQHSMCYEHISCKKDPKFKQLRFQLNKRAGDAYDEMLKFIREDNCLSFNHPQRQLLTTIIKGFINFPYNVNISDYFGFIFDTRYLDKKEKFELFKYKHLDIILNKWHDKLIRATNTGDYDFYKCVSKIKVLYLIKQIEPKCLKSYFAYDENEFENFIKACIYQCKIDVNHGEVDLIVDCIVDIIKNKLKIDDINKRNEDLNKLVQGNISAAQLTDLSRDVIIYADIIKEENNVSKIKQINPNSWIPDSHFYKSSDSEKLNILYEQLQQSIKYLLNLSKIHNLDTSLLITNIKQFLSEYKCEH